MFRINDIRKCMPARTHATTWFTSILCAGLIVLSGAAMAQDVQQPDGWCPSGLTPTPPVGFDRVFEPSIRTALDAQADTITLISNLPGPLPEPARNQIDEIAGLFNRVGLELITARTFALVATLPGPLPSPDKNAYRKALTAMSSADHFIWMLDRSIEDAYRGGSIDENTYIFLVGQREELVADLPVPTP